MNDEELRDKAIRRLKEKKEFRDHLMVYFVVMVALNVIWAVTNFGGYYWPIWPMFGWGVGVFFHGFAVFSDKPITEDDIEHEMKSLRPAR